MLIQIYEVQSPGEAQLMVDLGVDHVGSVLISEHQWKNRDLKTAVRVVQSSGRKSSLIPLFRNVDIIAAAVDYYRPDIIHFCETLTQPGRPVDGARRILARQKTIRDRFPELDIMRSIPIGVPGRSDSVPSLELGALFEPFSDWFLTDTLLADNQVPCDQDQPVSGYVGITGKTCDWQMASALVRKSRIPVILAGGIGPENVAAGISRVAPAGVDSCTLTNRVDRQGKVIRFQKDSGKVKALILSARQALLPSARPGE